jgi:D-amino-acid dehydrogenase
MRIAVLGAGIVGVASAHALAERGHEVHVYDRRSEIASDTSASTAGLIAPGHSYAWASPKAPAMLVKSLLGEATSIRVRPRADADLVRWGLRFIRECTPSRSRTNTLAKLRLARYSQQLMDNGRRQHVLDHDGTVALEPALGHSRTRFAGAIHDMSDGTGDPQRFAVGLSEACRRLGVTFHLGTPVTRLDSDGSSITRIIGSEGAIAADAVVLAAGAASPLLTRTMGLRIPVYPAKGYTLTATIKDPDRAPRVGGIDERTLVAWSRFGGELRMSATAEFVGYDRSSTPADYAGIIDAGDQLFPGAIDWDTARYRTGLRPMTPDGPPLIGLGKHDNLYFNTGHGHVGWTMACGSARILADLVDERQPDIDPTPYSPIAHNRHRSAAA